ncbi:MAG TPA: GAF domain-containing sensor histidine kinase [Actinomycetota bacterium]|nr:GAF domain-containing sensor histidine kinase [Actinomycetota bacterium]
MSDLVALETARTRLEVELDGLREERAADLTRIVRFHEIATRFVRDGDVDALLEDVLEAAMAITGTDLGNVQLYNPATGVLEIAAQYGFGKDFLEFFASVDGHRGACGAAMRTRRRVLVDDVLTDPIFQDPAARRIMIEAGARAVQSTPLCSRTGETLGVLSTHFRVPHRPSESALRFVDLLAGQVAEFIEHKRFEAERERLLAHERAARADAELANRVKDEFLARASHELRTPLTSILGSIRLLKQVMTGRRGGSPDELLDMASRNLAVMLGLLNDLLDASKLTAGETPLALESIGLADVVLASKEIVEAQACEKRITLRSVVPAEVTLQADPLKLVQVFTNLLANAVKFTTSGGEIVVEAETGQDTVIIRVRDTGTGIAREHLDHIFQPFYQARAARQGTRGPRGTGLGLSICRQIVTLHGGRIWAESEGPGRGATFIVQLPACSAAGRAA